MADVIKARRIVRPVPPKGVEPIPDGTMLADGMLDYIDDGAQKPPADAIYIATLDDKGAYAVVMDNFVAPAVHTFAGWPVPGEPVKKP